jgi:hypothetical protein
MVTYQVATFLVLKLKKNGDFVVLQNELSMNADNTTVMSIL